MSTRRACEKSDAFLIYQGRSKRQRPGFLRNLGTLVNPENLYALAAKRIRIIGALKPDIAVTLENYMSASPMDLFD